eukprot:XP_011453627.1 PREDICTED: uncharacterized protein LOC105346651 isoform X1 [Crassostrea gigas]
MYKCTFGTLFFMAGVSSVASIPVDWILSMKLCKINSQRPAKVNDIANKNVWIGAAKYRHNLGEVYLQITEEDRKRTCTSTDRSCPNTDDCEFCDIRVLGFKPSLNMLHILTPNIKYIVADFRSIEEIQEPDVCLLNTETFTKDYVSCKMEYEDGCRSTENFSNLKMIIIVQRNHSSSTESSTESFSENELMKSRGVQLRLNGVLMPLLAYIQASLSSI